VQPNQNQRDCLCEDRAHPNVEDHRSLLTTCSVNAKARNVNRRRQQTTQTTVFSGPSIRSIQSFPHQAVVKILVLVIAERPKASERFNLGMKSSKYRILQIRKLHRRLNSTMQPSSPMVEKQTKLGNADLVRTRSAKSKAGLSNAGTARISNLKGLLSQESASLSTE